MQELLESDGREFGTNYLSKFTEVQETVHTAVSAYLDPDPAETAAIPVALPEEFKQNKIMHHGSVLGAVRNSVLGAVRKSASTSEVSEYRQSFTPAKSAALRQALWTCRGLAGAPKGMDGQSAFAGLVKDYLAQVPAPSNLQVHLEGPDVKIQWSASEGTMRSPGLTAYMIQRSVGEEPGAWEDVCTTAKLSVLDEQEIPGGKVSFA